MTREEIGKLEAGRELDALVAEKVMGWRLLDPPQADQPSYWATWVMLPHREAAKDWSPSTNIAAAWEVVERLRANGYSWMQFTLIADQWDLEMGQGGHDIGCDTLAPTAPLAICRAALKAASYDDYKSFLNEPRTV